MVRSAMNKPSGSRRAAGVAAGRGAAAVARAESKTEAYARIREQRAKTAAKLSVVSAGPSPRGALGAPLQTPWRQGRGGRAQSGVLGGERRARVRLGDRLHRLARAEHLIENGLELALCASGARARPPAARRSRKTAGRAWACPTGPPESRPGPTRGRPVGFTAPIQGKDGISPLRAELGGVFCQSSRQRGRGESGEPVFGFPPPVPPPLRPRQAASRGLQRPECRDSVSVAVSPGREGPDGPNPPRSGARAPPRTRTWRPRPAVRATRHLGTVRGSRRPVSQTGIFVFHPAGVIPLEKNKRGEGGRAGGGDMGGKPGPRTRTSPETPLTP